MRLPTGLPLERDQAPKARLPVWLWPPLLVLGWLSAAHNSVGAAVRVAFSFVPFGLVYWSMLKDAHKLTASVRVWQVLVAFLCLHIGALYFFWSAVKEVNIWLLMALLVLETAAIGIAVANIGFPAQKNG
jgi:hypothetical protein